MKNYDMVYVIKPDLEPDAVKAVMDRMSQRIQELGGTIEVVDVWGKKRTSHRLRKYRDGLYVHTRFALAPDKVAEIRRIAGLTEEVLRATVTNAVGPTPQPKTPAPAVPPQVAPPSAPSNAPSPAVGTPQPEA
jgi:small subunit ribosomal protein S6